MQLLLKVVCGLVITATAVSTDPEDKERLEEVNKYIIQEPQPFPVGAGECHKINDCFNCSLSHCSWQVSNNTCEMKPKDSN